MTIEKLIETNTKPIEPSIRESIDWLKDVREERKKKPLSYLTRHFIDPTFNFRITLARYRATFEDNRKKRFDIVTNFLFNEGLRIVGYATIGLMAYEVIKRI